MLFDQVFICFATAVFYHTVQCLPARRFGSATTLQKIGKCIGKCIPTKEDYPRGEPQHHFERSAFHKDQKEKSSRFWINRYHHGKRMEHHDEQISRIAALENGDIDRAVKTKLRLPFTD